MTRTSPTWDRRLGLLYVGAALLLVGFIVVHKAWVTDDAYITFRTARNLVEGRGLTWNPAERVQVYTHPLWMFMASAGFAVTREFFYTSIALNLALTLAALWLLAFRLASSRQAACLGLAVLAASRAFTDFSTSGMETPLSHLLLIVLLLLSARGPRSVGASFGFSAVVSLLLLTRPDHPGCWRASGAAARGPRPTTAAPMSPRTGGPGPWASCWSSCTSCASGVTS